VAGTLMAGPLIECVPNFSEGRDSAKVAAIEHAIRQTPGALVLKSEMDPDHNRAVITFAGPPDGVAEAAFRGIEAAVERIDLRHHAGVHPRIGAADVVPIVPLSDVTMEQCAEIARQVGERVWKQLGVPVYFYGASAASSERAPLENVRRGGFEKPALAPDLGGPALHPTAGASILGARPLLIAFNINLNTTDLDIARTIARKIRASNGGFEAVKAMGVALLSRGCVQVSMNLTDFERTSIDRVLSAVRELAGHYNAGVLGTQIVGLAPRKAIEDAASRELEWKSFDGNLILENRIQAAQR
jgi:glutamate formiminotransferase